MWFAWADWSTTSADHGFVPFFAVTLAAASLAIMALAVTVRSDAGQQRLDLLLLVGSVAIVTLVGAAGASSRPLGSDEIALDQGSAIQLLHGVNPYTADLSFALHQFGVSVGTVTLDGGVVSSASYPPLSFLLYVPAIAVLGANSYASELVNLACWSLAAAVLWRLTAPRVRAWVPLFFALPVFFGPVTGGNVDTLALPFVLIALFSWDGFGDPEERSIARWIGPLALGAACAIKQNPWLLAPFLTIGVAIEARARGQDWRRITARYTSMAAGAFLLFNLPFMVWGPSAWLTKVLLPFTGGLIPSGVGPVDLIRAYGVGGGNLALFSAAAASALAGSVLLYVRHYSTLKRVLPLLPLAALLVSTRSLSTYFAFSVPAIAVCAASVRSRNKSVVGARTLRISRAGATMCAAASLAFLVGALATPAPLRLSVLGAHSSATSFTTEVHIDNHSGSTLAPHFVLAEGRDFRVPLVVVSGPPSVPAMGSATYALEVSEQQSMLRAGDAIQIQALTSSPATMSVTPPLTLPAASAFR
jgi:uncharacterized membrane protein